MDNLLHHITIQSQRWGLAQPEIVEPMRLPPTPQKHKQCCILNVLKQCCIQNVLKLWVCCQTFYNCRLLNRPTLNHCPEVLCANSRRFGKPTAVIGGMQHCWQRCPMSPRVPTGWAGAWTAGVMDCCNSKTITPQRLPFTPEPARSSPISRACCKSRSWQLH